MNFEDLPSELWFLILSYLSPLEAFYTFNNINNSRIQAILTDMYVIRRDDDDYSSALRISLAQVPLFIYNFAVSNLLSFYSNVIHSLTLSNDRTPGQIASFLDKYSFKYDFPYLKCLHLIEPTANEFDLIVNDLSTVRKVVFQSKEMHLFNSNTMHKLLYSKFSITDCHLSQFRQDFICPSSYSCIRNLVIHSCDYLSFITILDQFSLLNSLSIRSLSISRHVQLTSIHLMNHPVLVKHLKLRAISIPFDYLQIVFPYLENLRKFSFAILCNEGFDYVNSDKWQMIIGNYWPLLEKFEIYSELWHLTPFDIDELYPQLWAFRNHSFWVERQMQFIVDFYQDKSDFNLIFYSSPYQDEKFSNQWGYPIETVFSSSNTNDSLPIANIYRNVNHLVLTVYNNKHMKNELSNSPHVFLTLETLTLQFEHSVSSVLFGHFATKIMNLNSIKHLILNDRCHTVATFSELVRRLPNMTKLTITSNQRILIKQIFQKRNEGLRTLLGDRLLYLNLLYDGVINYETVQHIRFYFPKLQSFSACLPHFEDFRDAIPAFIYHMKSLQYLRIGLEGDNDKKNFTTQDMYHWFQRHNIVQELKLSIDTYTNSIHIWL
ncbi:unnamed protein product [Adineta ricciae]|uniref:F-box domain-containing protein n=1 Tax=Adineta ricciae TaxID=249248 RepID=A0A815BC42_ADIRI|nr:unnamed protein product [Adineta ricciae]